MNQKQSDDKDLISEIYPNQDKIIQNQTSNVMGAKSHQKKFSCGRAILLFFLVIIGIIVIFIIKDFISTLGHGTYDYIKNNNKIFSVTYPKKYKIKSTQNQVNPNPQSDPNADVISFGEKCLLYKPIFDCGYNWSLSLTVFLKDSKSFYANANDYLNKYSSLYKTNADYSPTYHVENIGNNDIYYFGNTKDNGVIFKDNFMVEVSFSQAPAEQSDIQSTISSLTFY